MARSSTSRRSAAAAKKSADDRRRNRMWLGGAGAAAVAVLVAVVVVAIYSGDSGSSASSGGNQADGVVENFSFTLFQGEKVLGAEKMEMDQLLGKPIVLNFWAGQCPPCRAEMPDLQRFYDGSKEDVTLLGIDVSQFTGLGTRRDARNLLKELGITYPAGYTGDMNARTATATAFCPPSRETTRHSSKRCSPNQAFRCAAISRLVSCCPIVPV